jgi:curved DNA-binding protein CbpA
MRLKNSSRVNIESPLIRQYREFLGVGVTASNEDIKKAYRRLALLYHPDKNPHPDAKSQFLKITAAYEILLDEDQVQSLNRKYVDKRLFDDCIEGLNISFGSFFGYRQFRFKRVEKTFRIGRERDGENDEDMAVFDFKGDESHSILDNPAFDSIELVFAGKFSLGDEERVMSGFKPQALAQLPWIVLNNRGILQFLDGDFESALKSYEELNNRIPNNIIFMYRLGLCHLILSFRKQRKSMLGKIKPDMIHFKRGALLLKQSIRLGENRPVGKQRCLTIRKILADCYEKAGFKKESKAIWQEVRDMQPRSKEALYKLTGRL